MVFSFFASKTILKLKKNCVCGLAQPRLHKLFAAKAAVLLRISQVSITFL